jgi:hypothetical protein
MKMDLTIRATGIMNSWISVKNFLIDDFKSYPLRFTLEVLAWSCSIGVSIGMAVTVPNPPLVIFYPIWIVSCAIYAWCAYTRKSFGLLANYVFLTGIDMVGLTRLLLNLN